MAPGSVMKDPSSGATISKFAMPTITPRGAFRTTRKSSLTKPSPSENMMKTRPSGSAINVIGLSSIATEQ